MSGIYFHIPFCKQACSYCDFHFSTLLAGKEQLVSSMLLELDKRKEYLGSKQLGSIYFGGGTPSLLSAPELETFFKKLAEQYFWDKNTEITLEANPDDITKSALEDWKKLGINRLSIGLQSFNDAELTWMNRAHTAAESEASVKLAQDAGFDNISIDLIYGSKFQTELSWKHTLQKAIDLKTQHISSYNLTIEAKTAIGVNYTKGKEPGVNDELSAKQFEYMQEALKQAEFIQYEISNFGKTGYFAKHNSNYWLQQHYLGIGPSAHSYNGLTRQWNVKNNSLYMRALRESSVCFEMEELSRNDRYNEYVLTRLRTIWGCDVNEINELFGEKYKTHFLDGISRRVDQFENTDDRYVLNEQSRFLADGIAADLFV
jgi:oxygen-independent coproporphyrinogen III oxidase